MLVTDDTNIEKILLGFKFCQPHLKMSPTSPTHKITNNLAMAMEGNVSSIYKLEYENGIWSKKKFQEIPTKNALKWKFFAIDRNYYLAVANFGNGDREMSRIYKWNWKKRRFTNHQGQCGLRFYF